MPRKRKPEASHYGDGSIYQLKDGTWKVEVRIRPGERPRVRRAATRAEAEQRRAELLALRESGVRVDMALEPFEVYANWWYNEVWLQKAPAERSQQHTIDMIQWYILPAIGKTPLIAVEHDQLQRTLNSLRRAKGPQAGEPLSPATKGQVKRVMQQMFRKAKKANYTKDDPSEDLVVPPIDRTPKEAPTVAHVRALLAAVEGHPHAIGYHIMATLGTRLGEMLALQRTHFNEDFSEVKIDLAISYHTLDQTAPKQHSRRPLPVPPALQARVRAQWEHVKLLAQDAPPGWNARGYLMPSEAGTAVQPSNFEKAWHGYTQRRMTKQGRKAYAHKGFKARAGLPRDMTIHSLRVFVATTLEDVDAPQRTISHILGHGAKNVTERYIRRSLPTMRRWLERLEAALWAGEEMQEEAM